MRCPCCGAVGFRPLTALENLRAQIWKIVGLVAFVSGAVVGQAELIGEPWRHWVTIACIVSTALVAWRLKTNPSKETT